MNTPTVWRAAWPLIALCAALALPGAQAQAELPIFVGHMPASGGRGMTMICHQGKATVDCPDAALAGAAGSHLVTRAYENSDFEQLETLFGRWCSGAERLKDGSWMLAQYPLGLRVNFYKRERGTLNAWIKAKPDSAAAAYANALYWHTQAWDARGHAPAARVSKESWEIYKEELLKSDAILHKNSARFGACPAWYALRITVLADLGKITEARTVFDESLGKFPRYQELYLAMAHAYEPRLGGSVAAYEAFAREAVTLAKGFEGNGMYARIYGRVDTALQIPFAPDASAYPSWPALRLAYDDLSARYPGSHLLANAYASVACRADDGALYRRQRNVANGYLIKEAFRMVSSDACDRKHGWKAPGA